MTKLLLAAALAWSGGAPAVSAELSDRDRAAIAALESRVVPLPGGIGSAQPASLAQRLAETRVPGVSVAFIENGRVKWTRAYGEAVAGSRRPVTPETRFQAASLSKAVAAAGALRLVDRGELTLDGNVNAGLKSWQVPAFQPSNGAGVTLRGLLSHTAGLTVAGYPGYARGAKVPSAAQSLAGVAPSNTPAVRAFAPPGKQFGYSGAATLSRNS
jgi:CubicO group peptidase (beta-lactamase class C family)